MVVPESVKKLGGALHQDILLTATTIDELAEGAVACLTRAEAAEAKAYLSKRLAGSDAAVRVRSLWSKLPAPILINKTEGKIALLTAVRDKL